MRRKLAVLALISAVGLSLAEEAGKMELKAGDEAPAFNLIGSDGEEHSLAGLKGKTVVLAWFPKAFTGG